MAVELLFQAPGAVGYPIAFVFGPDVQAPQQFDSSLDATLPALSGALVVRSVVAMSATVLLPAMTGSLSEKYVSNTARPTVAVLRDGMQVASGRIVGVQARDQQARPLQASQHHDAWRRAAVSRSAVRSVLPNTLVGIPFDRSPRHAEALGIRASLLAEYADTVRTRAQLAGAFSEAVGVQAFAGLLHQDAIRTRMGRSTGYGRGMHLTQSHKDGMLKSALPMALYRDARYREAWTPRAGVQPAPTTPPHAPFYVPGLPLDFVFFEPFSRAPEYVFRPAAWAPELPPAAVSIPVQRVYIVLNDVSIRRIDGNIQLPVISASMSLARDSWTWAFNATLPRDAYALLEPASSGDPVDIEVTINGAQYRMIVEDRERTRSFGKATMNITCRGLAALLDAPYAPVMQFGNTQVRTAAQLMADVLTLNGSPLGWTVDFNLDDWLVPANAYSHQGSYITALNAIAHAVGGYVQPHPTEQTLRVLPAYPSAPWNWGSMLPDYELPADVTTTERLRNVTKPEYNKVFVSGQQGGVLGEVKRAGTAGDLVAPMVTDPLITSDVAARQRGTAILSDTGRQVEAQLRLPVLAETGIILPGKTTRYFDGKDYFMGVVRAVQVDMALPQVWQQITVEARL